MYSCNDPTFGITCLMAVSLAPEQGDPERAMNETLAKTNGTTKKH